MGRVEHLAEGVTLYLGDCLEILPTLGRFDAVVTDPPYGINAARNRNSQKNGWVDYPGSGWDKVRPSPGTISMLDIACRRIEAALREPDMFIEPKPIEQLSMLDGAA